VVSCVEVRERARDNRLTSQGGSAEIWARAVAARVLKAVAIRNFILNVVLDVGIGGVGICSY